MSLNRRFLLSGAAAAALTQKAWGQVLISGGQPIICDGQLLGVPPTAPPTGGGGGGGPLSITVNNPAGQPTQVSPYFSMGMCLAKGDLPGSGFKLGLYDAAGTSKIMDLQVDQGTTGHPDGSHNYVVISGKATGTTLAAGSTATFTVKPEAGTPPATPVCTLTTLAAASDLKAICKIGNDTFTVSVNEIITNFGAVPPGTNPQGTVKQWKIGPTCCEWAFGRYLKRDSDGASHRWAFLKLYVTALSASGPFLMRGLLENIQSFGPNPGATVGVNVTTPGLEIVDSIDLYNGASFIGSMGGVNDNRKGTFAPANVNVATGELTVSFATGNKPAYSPIGFSSTGTLPGGLAPATTTTYWLIGGRTAGTVIPVINRWWAARFLTGNVTFAASVASGTTAPLFRYTVSGGALWAVTTSGVSAGLAPSGPGPTFTDGTVVWTLVSAPLTSQGTGTHTMQTKAAIARASKAPLMASDTYPFWSTAGNPKLLCGQDFHYLTTQTKAIHPLDPTITAGAWRGSFVVYNQNVEYMPGGGGSMIDIGGTGEPAQSERVNPFSPASASCIYLPNDLGHDMNSRYVALSFMDRPYHYRDETVQQILATDHGPDKLGGTYPGLGVTRPTVNYSAAIGSPISVNNSRDQWGGYGDFTTGVTLEVSHNPNPYYYNYIRSGDPLFLDAMIEYAASMQSGSGGGNHIRTAVVNGVRYDWAWTFNQQARGAGWQLKIFSQAEWVTPDSHLAKPFLTNVMDDSAAVALPYMRANLGPVAQSVGWVPMGYATLQGSAGPLQAIEPWMYGYLFYHMAWEAWKGNRPAWKTFLETYFSKMYMDLWDSDVGGSILAVDSQWVMVGINPGNGPQPPQESEIIVPVRNRFTANAVESSLWPPPGPKFVKGIQTQQASLATGYVYWTGNINIDPPSAFATVSYGLAARACMILGSAVGIAQCTKLLARTEAVIAAQYPGKGPATWVAPASGGGQPSAIPAGNPNSLEWAIAVPS